MLRLADEYQCQYILKSYEEFACDTVEFCLEKQYYNIDPKNTEKIEIDISYWDWKTGRYYHARAQACRQTVRTVRGITYRQNIFECKGNCMIHWLQFAVELNLKALRKRCFSIIDKIKFFFLIKSCTLYKELPSDLKVEILDKRVTKQSEYVK